MTEFHRDFRRIVAASAALNAFFDGYLLPKSDEAGHATKAFEYRATAREVFKMLRIFVGLMLTLLATSTAYAVERGEVFRAPSCGCCHAWAEHMRSFGFELTLKDLPRSELDARKQSLGVGGKFVGCHTAMIGGYVIEGHVPAPDVKRLLETRPDAIGLSVPGMPAGSPGMETGGQGEAYDVLLIKKDGTSEIFQHYDASPAPPAAN